MQTPTAKYEDLKGTAPDFAVASPVHKLERMGQRLGLPNLYIKRDDLTDFYGNKTRHAKYILAYLLRRGVTSIEIVGPADSNTVRIYGMAARRAGIASCIRLQPGDPCENLTVTAAMTSSNSREETAFVLRYDKLKEIAALGYVEASDELFGQLPEVDHIYLYSYDATWIGLSVGTRSWPSPPEIVAVRPNAAPHGPLNSPQDSAHMDRVYKAVEHLCGCHVQDRRIDRRAVGGDFSTAIQAALNHDGILLDPVYTGRAMHCLVEDARGGRIPKDATVLFLHTGGVLMRHDI